MSTLSRSSMSTVSMLHAVCMLELGLAVFACSDKVSCPALRRSREEVHTYVLIRSTRMF